MTDTKSQKSVTSEEKIWGAVSYLWILSLVALAARKNNQFVRFHASQGALLFAISLILMLIPGIGWLLNILIGIAAIIGIIKALQGEKWEVPAVGQFSTKFADWLVKTLKL
ncbi:MAG: hypothetical protein HUU49_03445 [Candidatus Buchananbacteria bacterium]|nr:hypothetical protein [Candidatus Buchananbacteria bacterium]